MKLSPAQYEQLIELARGAMPHEACGLMAGDGDRVREIVPLTNVERNPVGCGWRADSGEQYRAFQRIDDEDLDLVAIYHSHPRSEAYPSDRDVENALFTDARYVIVSLLDAEAPAVKAFRIEDGRVDEEAIVVG